MNLSLICVHGYRADVQESFTALRPLSSWMQFLLVNCVPETKKLYRYERCCFIRYVCLSAPPRVSLAVFAPSLTPYSVFF